MLMKCTHFYYKDLSTFYFLLFTVYFHNVPFVDITP